MALGGCSRLLHLGRPPTRPVSGRRYLGDGVSIPTRLTHSGEWPRGDPALGCLSPAVVAHKRGPRLILLQLVISPGITSVELSLNPPLNSPQFKGAD